MGRPMKIDQVVATRQTPDGEVRVTAAERIVEILRLGGYFEQACSVAGVPKQVAYGWARMGADATAREYRAAERGTTITLTANERRCQTFSDAVASAEYEWETQALGSLERLARGNIPVETRTVKMERNDKGDLVEVETTVRTTRTLPDAKVIMWRLERRFPERYGHKVDVTSGGLPLQEPAERAKQLAEQAREHLATVTPIEATATDKPKARRKPKVPAPAAVEPAPRRRRKAT